MANTVDGHDVIVDYEAKYQIMEYGKSLQEVINDMAERIKELERRFGDG